MAQSGFAAFLLFLSLVVSNVYGDNTTILCDQILTANTTLYNANNSDFRLTVLPAELSNNTEYIVQLDAVGNFTVLFEAVSLSGLVGNWSQGNLSCNGRPLFTENLLSSKQITTNWTSPDNETSVTINAYIYNGTTTFHLNTTLSQVSIPNVNATTKAPTTGNSTAANSTETTKTPGSAATTHTIQSTTGAGSIEQSSLISMALSVIFSLLLIPNKCL